MRGPFIFRAVPPSELHSRLQHEGAARERIQIENIEGRAEEGKARIEAIVEIFAVEQILDRKLPEELVVRPCNPHIENRVRRNFHGAAIELVIVEEAVAGVAHHGIERQIFLPDVH